MLTAKAEDLASIDISSKILKKLDLKDGTVITGRIEKGKLLIVKEKEDITDIMKYAGMWKEEKDVEQVFKEIRKDWSKWKKTLHA